MKSYIKGFITSGLFVFLPFIFSGQTNIKLSKKDIEWYTSKDRVRPLIDLELSVGKRIDALSNFLSLWVYSLENDIKLLNDRLNFLGQK